MHHACCRAIVIVLFAFPAVASGQILFEFAIADQTVSYVPGLATEFTVSVTIEELSGVVNDTQGFSMGVAHDDVFVVATESNQGPIIAALNSGAGPDFWGDSVTDFGVTLGCVYNLTSLVFLTFPSAEPVLEITYEVQPTLSGGVLSTSLEFSEALSRVPGGPVVINLVTIFPTLSAPTTWNSGTLTLMPSSGVFIRGDCNDDASYDISDGVFLLGKLFPSGAATVPPCDSSCDGNDDGALDIADVVRLLETLFVASTPPLEPPSDCGGDPTPDSLSCDSFAGCE